MRGTLNRRKYIFFAFVIAIGAFVALKTQHLSTPFFWDETGVYGRMAFHLADTGPSLHPASVDQWLSRGHPLLYPFLIASFCTWFGTTTTVAHLANLLITLLLIFSVSVHTSRLYGFPAALLSVLFLIVQPIFFAQSIMVLPEITLSLCLWYATWAFYRRNLLLYITFGSIAVLVKEPAIVWVIAVFLFDFLFIKPRLSAASIRFLVPLIPFLVFLIVQKQTWGYYLFPYHSESINLSIAPVLDHFMKYMHFLFWEQGRAVIPCLVLPAGLYALGGQLRIQPDFRAFGWIAFFVCLMYVLFLSTSFFLGRYLLPLFPFLAILVARLLVKCLENYHVAIATAICAIAYIIPASKISGDQFDYDNDMAYLRSVEATKKALQYIIDHDMYKPNAFSVNMPLIYAIADKRFGYLPAGVEVYHSHQISDQTEYVVQMTPGTSLENPDNLDLELIHQEAFDGIKMSVYRTNTPE